MVVPARGGLGDNVELQANTIATVLAQKLGASYRQLYVPDCVSEDILNSILKEDIGVRAVVDIIKQADILVHGVGRASVMARHRRLGSEVIAKLEADGAVGEAFGQYCALDGRQVYMTNNAGLMLQDLQHTVDFDLVFLAMDPGYAPEGRKHLEENAKRLDIPLEIFDTDVLRVAGVHSAEHPCFLCAKMRRGYLYTEARKRGCNKIALGHHYDDAIGTVLMGLIYGGQMQAMLPRVKAKNYEGMELIRPLYFTREQSVIDWAEYCGLTFLPCDCPAKKLESDTKRAEIKQLIASLAANNPQIEANIFNAVKNVDTAKLLGWRDANGKHNFLDQFE